MNDEAEEVDRLSLEALKEPVYDEDGDLDAEGLTGGREAWEGGARELSPNRWPRRVTWFRKALAERRTTSESLPWVKNAITAVIILATSNT